MIGAGWSVLGWALMHSVAFIMMILCLEAQSYAFLCHY
jgi:hypothetical protein